MLKAFRDNLKYLSWVLWLVIIAFILIEFVIFGQGGAGVSASDDVAVSVGKQTVSYSEFETEYRNMEGVYRQAYGEAFNADFARQLGLHSQVLDKLVADRILLLEANRLGLGVNNEEIQKTILELPVFQAADGGFIGAREYEQILRQNGLTADSFEQSVKRDLLLAKVRNVVGSSVYVADREVEEAYRKKVERATVRFFRAPYESLAGEITLNEPELAAYLETNPDRFETPERRIVDYLLVDTEQIKTAVALDDSEVRGYYDSNSAEFDQPEQVRARHILLRVNDERTAEAASRELEEVKQRISSGEDFGALAAEISEDPGSKTRDGDLGFFGRGAMVEPFDRAAFSATPGTVVGPIQTDFGYHLIEVLERNEGGVRPFEEVEGGIRQRLLDERAQTASEAKANELAEAGSDLAAQAESEPGVTFQTSPAFAVDENVPSMGRNTPFAQAAFDLAIGEVSTPVRVASGWALLKLTEIEEPRVPELDEVRAEVEAALRAARQREAALERLSAESARGLDELAEEAGVEIEEATDITRDGLLGTLGESPETTAAVFAASEGSLEGPIATENGAVMVEVVALERMDPAKFEEEKGSTRSELEVQRVNQLLAALVQARREEIGVTFDPQLLATFGLDSATSSPS